MENNSKIKMLTRQLAPCALVYRGRSDAIICDLVFDSREVKENDLFFALSGVHSNGHEFIETVITKGASCIVHSEDLAHYHEDVAYIQVENTRHAMSSIAARFYDYPANDLVIIGVTGTDGKSSTVSYIHQTLEKLGLAAGFISTVNIQTGDKPEPNNLRQSTPEAPFIHKALRTMCDNGKKYAVIEATSHALDTQNSRLRDLAFDYAVCTNISHEHLEFHGTFENYFFAKSQLVQQLKPTGKLIVNREIDNVKDFILANKKITQDQVYYYGTSSPTEQNLADLPFDSNANHLYIENFEQTMQGLTFSWRGNFLKGESIEGEVPLFGAYNLENLEATFLVCHFCLQNLKSTPFDQINTAILTAFQSIQSPKGRMSLVPSFGQNYTTLVDYAHTPASFEKIMDLMQQKSLRLNRLLVLFGSAGERDTKKRPLQGQIADKYADVIILTDEDPRLEDPMQILTDIAAGINNKVKDETLFLIPNRLDAIKKLISLAEGGDLLLCLGKGHETSIIQADGKHEWDEEKIVRQLIQNSL